MNLKHEKTILSVNRVSIGKPESSGRRARVLVQDLDFAVAQGKTLGIMGQSGAGKTLTLSAAGALLPGDIAVLSGHVRFCGEPVHANNILRPGFARGRDILVLLQSPLQALDPTAKVMSQVAETLSAQKIASGRGAKTRAGDLMTRVGLPERHFNKYPFQLSGGQRQRVLLAMAFGLAPRVLIADEPTAGQDDENRDHILDLLVLLQEKTGSAVIIVSHDLRVLKRLSHEIVVLHKGRQVEKGPTRKILSRPCHWHTRQLVAAMNFLEDNG